MNNKRRQALRAIRARLEAIQEEIETLQEEEREAYENLPECLQEGERGQQMEAAEGALADASSYLSEATYALDQATGDDV